MRKGFGMRHCREIKNEGKLGMGEGLWKNLN